MTRESKREWLVPEISTIENFIESLLTAREIPEDERELFLAPSMDQVPGWEKLHGAGDAAEQIIRALKADGSIFIHGDFDCDGVCATAILWGFLAREVAPAIGSKSRIMPYIPGRVDEGYGLSSSSVDAMVNDGAQLIITVDCGVRDKELIKAYMSKASVGGTGKKKIDPESAGLEFIVTDHHQPPEDLLEGLDYTIVHQMFPGEEYPYQKICGTAVAQLLVEALGARVKAEFDKDLETRNGLDLVALATVADMMPLLSVNRIWVNEGLKQIREGKRTGIRALLENAKVAPEKTDSYHLGFVIAPRVNAAGRIGSAMDPLKLMLTDKPDVAHSLALKLNSLNFKRQELTEEILKASHEQVNPENKLIFVYGEGWPEGIIGLVAAKLLEHYAKPTVVMTSNEGIYKGSCRSLKGFNITDALSNFKELLEKYGGHEQAAGFTLKPDALEEFRSGLVEFANKELADKELVPRLDIDLQLDTDSLTIELIESLKKLEPFGYGNRKPMVMIPQVVITALKTMGAGNNHLRMTFKGGGFGSNTAVMFDCLEDIKQFKEDQVLDIAGYLDINEWNGQSSVQLQILEWRRANL